VWYFVANIDVYGRFHILLYKWLDGYLLLFLVNRCVSSNANMLFSNQKVFLDVKDYGKIDRLEADIRQFGGVIEKFLSKEITCVVTNRARTENLSQQKDVGSQSQLLRPSASGSRVLSRGQSLLMRSNSLKDTVVCDPVTFAHIWGIKTVTLETVLQDIERQLPACTPSSPASKQSIKSQPVKKRTRLVKVQDVGSNLQSFLTKFSGAFIKFEDFESNFRPFFHQYSTFPHLDLESDLSNGIFRCSKNTQPVTARKNVSTAATARKQKACTKRGYCECCDVMYEDLNQHLISANHKRFAENVDNFADLDKLIDHIQSCDSSVNLVPSEDNCRHLVAGEIVPTKCTEEMQQMNNDSPLTAVVESASCCNANSRSKQSSGHQSEPGKPDRVVNAVENNAPGEQTDNRSTVHISVSGVFNHSVNFDNYNADDVVDDITDKLHSQRLPVCNDGGDKLSKSVTVSQSVDFCDTNEGMCKEKSCNISAIGNLSRGDETSELISSNYVLNLLELLSSESSINSAHHANKVMEACEESSSIAPLKSPCIPSACSQDATPAELLPNEKEYCQHQTSVDTVDDKNCFPFVAPQLGKYDAAVMMERHNDDTDKCASNSKHTSELPGASRYLPTLTSVDAVAVSDTSLSTNIGTNCNGILSCNVKVDEGTSVLPLHEVNVHGTNCNGILSYNVKVDEGTSVLPLHDSYISHAAPSIDQAAVCATNVNTEPAYVQSHVNNVCTFVEDALLPVPPSDPVTESFDLHDKLLTMAVTPNTVEHDHWQSYSPVHASYPCLVDSVDFSTSSNNNYCLSLAFGLPLCFSEDSAPPADCSDDAGLCTPVHSHSDSFEKPTAFATDNNTLTELTSPCQSSPFSGVTSFTKSSARSSVPCMGWQMNTDMNIATDKEVNECLVQEKEESQINSRPLVIFEREIKSNETVKCISLHGSEDCYHSATVATTQLETTSVADDSCGVTSLSNISGSPVSKFSGLSLNAGNNNNSCNVEPPESCDTAEPVVETDADNDSASTMIYDCDHLNSSILEHADDGNSLHDNESETTEDYSLTSVSSASSRWKVISFGDSRMRLIRSEPVFPTVSTQNSNMSSVLEPESHHTIQAVKQLDSDSISTLAYGCDCSAPSVQDQVKIETETTGETPVSSANSTWKVISCADCRMRLVRINTVFLGTSAQAVT